MAAIPGRARAGDPGVPLHFPQHMPPRVKVVVQIHASGVGLPPVGISCADRAVVSRRLFSRKGDFHPVRVDHRHTVQGTALQQRPHRNAVHRQAAFLCLTQPPAKMDQQSGGDALQPVKSTGIQHRDFPGAHPQQIQRSSAQAFSHLRQPAALIPSGQQPDFPGQSLKFIQGDSSFRRFSQPMRKKRLV